MQKNMKININNEVNAIAPRANAKIVSVGGRSFLIGGMTADKVTNDIYQFRTIKSQKQQTKIEWQLMKFKDNVFKPRNSFSACGSKNCIYIWGGLETEDMDQTLLSDLIEVDIEKGKMRSLQLKEKIKIHSAVLMYDEKNNQLIGLGGTNEVSTMESFLYRLDLGEGEYEWKKSRLDSEHHKGYLWQHTAHLSRFSYFNGAEGTFITVIGGCRYPHSPYNSIVEFDLQKMVETNSTTMKTGLVSHDSVATEDAIVIFGGATGGDFNSQRITLMKGEVSYQEGHNAVGCMCYADKQAFYVIGGVCGVESLNRVIIYLRN